MLFVNKWDVSVFICYEFCICTKTLTEVLTCVMYRSYKSIHRTGKKYGTRNLENLQFIFYII